jgi:hypothetical protein
VARRARRRDAIQLGLETQRQHRLVFGMRVPRGDEGDRLEDRVDDGGIVLTERLRGDERAHIEETIGLAVRVAVDDRKVRSHGFGRIERDRQREEEAP